MRRRLISTIRERRPENVARRTLTKRAPCSTYSTYSASSAAFVFCAAAKGSAATLHNTAQHCTTLSTYFTLYSFLGFIPFSGAALDVSVHVHVHVLVECESSAWKLRHAWNLLCFMPHFLLLRHALPSLTQIRLELHLLVFLCLSPPSLSLCFFGCKCTLFLSFLHYKR